MIWVLITLCILLTIATIVSIYYALRFARIIFVVEDDLSESIESLNQCVKTFEKILGMKLFFDSPEVRPILMEAMAEIKISKLAVQGIIAKFTEKSKQKYVQVEDKDEDEV
jgi:hypothetical protein